MKLSPPTGGARKMGLMQNGANERWLVVREDGQLWLHEGGPEAFDRLVTRSELRTRYPRLYSPTLQIESVRSAQHPAFTPPKLVEPATASFPGGASPRTRIEVGLDGSSLNTSMVADLSPKLTGAKRIGAGKKPPGEINNG